MKSIGHQGDTWWFEIQEKVDLSTLQKIDKKYIVESSVTNAVHALCGEYDMYEASDGFIIDLKGDAVLNHTYAYNVNGAINTAVELPVKDHRPAHIKGNRLLYVGIHRKVDPIEGYFINVED